MKSYQVYKIPESEALQMIGELQNGETFISAEVYEPTEPAVTLAGDPSGNVLLIQTNAGYWVYEEGDETFYYTRYAAQKAAADLIDTK